MMPCRHGNMQPPLREADKAIWSTPSTTFATGRPVAPTDCQIAAIARSRDLALATRNAGDFEDIGIKVVDPWAAT